VLFSDVFKDEAAFIYNLVINNMRGSLDRTVPYWIGGRRDVEGKDMDIRVTFLI
jgi:hypothetical protein